MRLTLPPLSELSDLPVDTIIDTRSPSEYAEDHIPGAINLPVLSDAERAQVGTIYVQEDPFKARKLGAALVSRNAAAHLEGPLAEKGGGWRPLVYCWRGGQRSGSFGVILEQIGWRVQVLNGGYQAYRRAVVTTLYEAPIAQPMVLLDGNTGTAKTDLLHLCALRGAQVLDLEGLANHRGSVLGPRAQAQPSQKMFETRLAKALAQMDPTRPLLVEAESAKVGDLQVPPSVWKAMQAGPRITVTASLEDRARYLASAYADLVEDTDALRDRLDKLLPYVGRDVLDGWKTMIAEQAFEALAADLMARHYDPRYIKGRPEVTPLGADLAITLDTDGLARAADAICARLATAP